MPRPQIGRPVLDMRDIYLLRHTEVGVPKTLCYGRTDVPLGDAADIQIEAAIERLPSAAREAQTVWTSPARRCTALAERLSAEATIDPRLVEFDFGHWEGAHWTALPQLTLSQWSANVGSVRVPGGENLVRVAARAGACLADAQAAGEGPVLLVTHGGVIRALIASLCGLAYDQVTRLAIDFGRSACIRLHATHAELRYLNR